MEEAELDIELFELIYSYIIEILRKSPNPHHRMASMPIRFIAHE